MALSLGIKFFLDLETGDYPDFSNYLEIKAKLISASTVAHQQCWSVARSFKAGIVIPGYQRNSPRNKNPAGLGHLRQLLFKLNLPRELLLVQ